MSAPCWYNVLTEVLSEDQNTVYTLSTVSLSPSGSFPRSRSVIHRGIMLPSPTRPLLLTTTDIRTPKAQQLRVNANSEATFWFAGPKVQFRVLASTYILSHPTHAWYGSFPGRDLACGIEFDWDKTRLDVFDGLSEYLRASFVRPVPGSPMENYEEAKKWPNTVPQRGQAEQGEQSILNEALANFALVILDPSQVEFLELGPIPNKRTVWLKRGGQWDKQILVP